ncbi:GAF and ANTAR domain-containing protein [Solicola sp. PLA-1-18]|uniref:GAF and ANTAR domain-containing protein n=1 Tax=Solicola sp. PLA-1-18 TaxID=3380532 RepID=UPI003B7747CB
MTADDPTVAPHEQVNELVTDFLESTASSTHRRLGDVAGVAVSTVDRSAPITLGASTPLAAEVDRIQFDIGTGPCLNALRTGEGMYVPDLAADDRWGEYGPRAAERGAAACISVPVAVDGRTVAVFKVYAHEVDGLDERQRTIADAVGQEVAGGFALAQHLTRQADEIGDLTALIASRRAIDLAIGISMARAGVGAEEAFALLRTQSQHSNVKLRDVAAQVVLSVPGTHEGDLEAPFDPPS